MKSHDTYRYAVTADDIDQVKRDRIVEEIAVLLEDSDGPVEFEECSEGMLELTVPDRIPNTKKAEVRETFRQAVPYSFGPNERVLLELHVSWPTPRYRVCIGFE